MAELTKPEHFDTVLDFAFGIADRGIPLSLVLVEPDGWPGGALTEEQEEALRRLSTDVAERTRRSDRVTCLGGARFAALLVDCNRQGAVIFADRLQVAAEAFSLASGCTVSCGVATYGWAMKQAGDLLDAAVSALERAHETGGDRIEIHEGSEGEPGGG